MPNVLSIIADNQALIDALKELFVNKFMKDGAQSDAISDELLGQMYRARLIGLQKIDEVFKEVSTYKTRRDLPRGPNPAR